MEDSIQSRTAPPKRNPDHPDGGVRFTPGPWRAEADTLNTWNEQPRIHSARDSVLSEKLIAVVGNAEDQTAAGAEWDANAHLIAAAPDLYAALEPFRNAPTYFDIPDDVIVFSDAANSVFVTAGDVRAIKAALAKASGGKP